MTVPVQLDGVTFSDATDYVAFARETLRGVSRLSFSRHDALPLDALTRAFEALRETPFADALSRSVAACLTDPLPFVRKQALLFFEKYHRAEGADRIDALVQGDRTLFAGVLEPPDDSEDLEWLLLRVLGARAASRQGQALELARAEALRPGRAAPVVAGVTAADPDWAIAHAEEIVRGTPGALGPLLYNVADCRRDAAALGERLARRHLMDRDTFVAEVESAVWDPATRRRILAALPTEHT